MHVETVILISDQELARSTDINFKDVFVFHPYFILEQLWMNIEPINRTTEVLLPADSTHGITSLIKK